MNHLLLTVCFLLVTSLSLGGTLNNVRDKGFVDCGVHSSLPGFAIQSDQGWEGMEVTLCRAVAAAVLGNARLVRFTPFSSNQGFTALQSGDIDLLVRHTPWSMAQDSALGLSFVAPWYFEQRGFLVLEESGIEHKDGLLQKKACLYPGALKQDAHQTLSNESPSFSSFGIAAKAFENGQCDALPGDLAQLYIARSGLPADLGTKVLEASDPIQALGPVVRQKDMQWFKIVRWTLYLILNAEQLGLNQNAALQLKEDQDNPYYTLLRQAGFNGIGIGLQPEWPFHVLQQTGHYGEIFERHLGHYSIPRNLNALSRDGGLHYPPPFK